MTSTSKIILSLLGATAAGIAIGMLMAPEKGAEIRKKISETANDMASKVNDLIEAGKDKISDIAGTVTKQAEGLATDAVKRSEKLKESVG